jgi:hypothetical protein
LEIYLANAFGGTFAFLQPHKARKKSKRATKPTHQDSSKQVTDKARQKAPAPNSRDRSSFGGQVHNSKIRRFFFIIE